VKSRAAPEIFEDTDQAWIQAFLTSHGVTWETGPPMRYDQFGNDYVELLLFGPVPYSAITHHQPVTYARTVEQAKAEYQRVLLGYLGENRHVVWRIEPEISGVGKPPREFPLFAVYSRLTAYPSRIPNSPRAQQDFPNDTNGVDSAAQ